MKQDKIERLKDLIESVELSSATKIIRLTDALDKWDGKEYDKTVGHLKRAKQEIFDLFQEK